MLGTAECAIDTSWVREICAYEAPTEIAGLSHGLCGVINLRGAIIPVLDVRRRLQLPAVAVTRYTATIILSLRDRALGAIVDSVSDVITVDSRDVVKPALLSQAHGEYLGGIVPAGDRLIMVIDVEALVTDKEPAWIDESAVAALLQESRHAGV